MIDKRLRCLVLPLVPLAAGVACPPASSAQAGATAAQQAVALVSRDPHGATFRVPDGLLTVTLWNERTAQVTIRREAGPFTPVTLAQIGSPAPVAWTMTDEEGRIVLATAAMQIVVDKRSGVVVLNDAAGKFLVAEADPGSRRLGDRTDPEGPVQQRFEIRGSQSIHGLGQHQAGVGDYRGTTTRLQQANSDVGVPVLVSTAGFGLFWNNPAVSDVVVDTPQLHDRIAFRSQAGDGVDYFLFAGPDIDAIVGAYRRLTGQAPLMARWTWGLWQSKERYATQAELVGVAERYRALGIPLDAVVQDWQYWKPGEWGSHRLDPARYPDGKGMLDALHRQKVHSIVSVWPRFDAGLDTTRALDAVGGLYAATYPNVYPAGEGRWYDAFSATARAIYWRDVSERLGRIGFDGFWLDGSEAELGGRWGQMREVTTALGSGARVYNAYPLMHTTAVYEGMMRDIPAKRPIILTRSAWAGQQRNAAITWSGDIAGRWDVLRAQVPAATNFSMTGIPYWSVDIGGFFGGDPRQPEYPELFTRWLQFAAFNPMFRIHGTGGGKEIYNFPAGAQPAMIDTVKLRYRMLPFFYAQSWQVTDQGASFLYPLDVGFPADADARDRDDQFLFGRKLLVSPVVHQGATRRSLYLPAGQDWYDFWTGERHAGGATITVSAPIDQIPLHVAAGSILPLGAAVPYADRSPTEPVELRVYRGADGRLLLYDDAGDGQAWRRGEHATIPLVLDDRAGTLTIGARQGRYPTMPATRQFRIAVVRANRAVGLAEAKGREVRYDGTALTIDLDDL